jgi:hypothetical protein
MSDHYNHNLTGKKHIKPYGKPVLQKLGDVRSFVLSGSYGVNDSFANGFFKGTGQNGLPGFPGNMDDNPPLQ